LIEKANLVIDLCAFITLLTESDPPLVVWSQVTLPWLPTLHWHYSGLSKLLARCNVAWLWQFVTVSYRTHGMC